MAPIDVPDTDTGAAMSKASVESSLFRRLERGRGGREGDEIERIKQTGKVARYEPTTSKTPQAQRYSGKPDVPVLFPLHSQYGRRVRSDLQRYSLRYQPYQTRSSSPLFDLSFKTVEESVRSSAQSKTM